MSKPFLYVANWKMGFTHTQATTFFKQLLNLKTDAARKLVICPSFTDISAIAQLNTHNSVALGAQSCSRHRAGAYTGEVSAQTLAELGCAYCIVGHSERRMYHNESDLHVAAQVERLLEVGITPIICIGETKEQYEKQETKIILLQQLDPVFSVISQFSNTTPSICIAYEPVWAIGTGLVPDAEYLASIFSWLAQLCTEFSPDAQYQLLYGGSINGENALQLRSVAHVDGFLIGGASLDFKKFENIVS